MKLFSTISCVFFSVFSSVSILFSANVEPAKDAVAFNGNHYKAFLDTNSTWWEAKFACDDIGGELVVIGDAKEKRKMGGHHRLFW